MGCTAPCSDTEKQYAGVGKTQDNAQYTGGVTETFVVIEIAHGDEKSRTGRIVEVHSPSQFTVEWQPGNLQEVKLGSGLIQARVGSPRYLQYTAPDKLQRMMTEAPLEFFVAVIREEKTAKTAQQLKASAGGYGLNPGAVAKAWKLVEGHLAEHEAMNKTTNAKPTYSWRGTPPEGLTVGGGRVQSALDSESEQPVNSEGSSAQSRKASKPVREGMPNPLSMSPASAEASKIQEASPSLEPVLRPGRTRRPSKAASKTNTESAASSSEVLQKLALTNSSRAEQDELVAAYAKVSHSAMDDLIFALITDGQASSSALHGFAQAPLASALLLLGYPSSLLECVVASLEDETKPTIFSLLAPLQRRLKFMGELEFTDWAASQLAVPVLALALAETNRASTERRTALRPALIALARHFLWEKPNTFVGYEQWAGLLVALRDSSATDSVRVQGSIVDRVTHMIRAASRDGGSRPTRSELERLAVATKHLPLEKHDGRAALIAAVGRIEPSRLSEPTWWVGLDFDALVRVGDGVVSETLRIPDLLEKYVVPLVTKATKTASTRRDLTRLMGESNLVAAQIAPQVLVTAFERVAERDTLASQWLDQLNNKHLLESLRAERESNASLLTAAQSEITACRADLERASEQAAKLREKLALAGDAVGTLRDQEKRQIEVSAVKALAQLAAMVEAEATQLEPATLTARVQAFLKRQNLQAIGRSGVDEPFDPANHEAPGSRPAIGEAVDVVRSGYIWTTRDEDVLLIKALVAKKVANVSNE